MNIRSARARHDILAFFNLALRVLDPCMQKKKTRALLSCIMSSENGDFNFPFLDSSASRANPLVANAFAAIVSVYGEKENTVAILFIPSPSFLSNSNYAEQKKKKKTNKQTKKKRNQQISE
jgi:hypothetical protein